MDKPAGMTSHDVVAVVRRAARTKRVGHAGTLDPFATGLLVVAVGSFTRLLPYLDGEPKVYDAVIRFGVATDTDDLTGREIATAPPPDLEPVMHAIASLTGVIQQVPPAYSAKHVDGERAYDLARRGSAPELSPVAVTVHRWESPDFDGASLRVRVVCAGGTYVRALARDLGALAGSVAHCAELRRVRSGPADVADACPFQSLAPGAIVEGTVPLLSPLPFLADTQRVDLDAHALTAVRHGRTVALRDAPIASRAALMHEEQIVAIAERADSARGAVWQPKVVFA